MEISDPSSEKYGQHMSANEVGDFFRPSKETIDTVRDWLHSSGIDTGRHEISPGRGWLKFDASIDELESLLSTEYHIYEHAGTGEQHIGCDDYHVPHTVHPHIDFITPSVSTLMIDSQAARKARRAIMKSFSPASFPPHVQPAAGISTNPNAFAKTAIPCHTAVTPDCLRSKSILR